MSGGPAHRFEVRRIEGSPVVAVRAVLVGGARVEERPGQALVAGRMLIEGTARRDWRALAELSERRGMSITGFGALESHGVAIDALAEEWPLAIDLAAELLFESTFPADRLSWIARHAAAELAAQDDEAQVMTARAFLDLLYAPHPKGRPLHGDRDSLLSLTGEECARWHRRALGRRAVLVVAGELDAGRVERAVRERFAVLSREPLQPVAPEPPPPPAARRSAITTRARDQAHLYVGQLTVGRGDDDYEALELAGVALGAGAGLSGRIPQRIRDVEGLAYEASADAVAAAGSDPGRLVAYVGTAPENLERAEAAIREELVRLLADGIEARELVEARAYLVGREPFRRESARQWADLAAQAAVLDVPFEDPEWRVGRLARVGLDDVRAAVERHLDPERLGVVVGLPAD